MDSYISSCSVSSILNRDSKQFGKMYMFDDKEDTCWNSDQGENQWVLIKLKDKQVLSSFSIQFQGGFSGKICTFKAFLDDGQEREMKFYPEDNNTLQNFKLEESLEVISMQFIFDSTSDFFGRIIIYKLSWQ